MKLRSKTQQDKRRETVQGMTGVSHFGTNVQGYVAAAKSQGGSLDEDSRRAMYGKIKQGGVSGDSLSAVLPGFMAQHVQAHQSSFQDVHQVDLRVDARKTQSYIGHQITSTRVDRAHDAQPSDKTISEPLSPQPVDDGSYHRTHASPFNLVGTPSNSAHTVWAPGWANITVDGHMEKRAQQAANKGHEVHHFRFDTDTHSTVGYVKQRNNSKKDEYKAFAATYERR